MILLSITSLFLLFLVFFFNDTATTEIYTLSLHDALPILSLGNHLSVTVSPQSPLPAGYVSLLVDSRSPPLGLMLPHSRKQAHHISSFLIAFQTYASPISRGEAHRR